MYNLFSLLCYRFEEDVPYIDHDMKFRIEFTIDRLSLRLMHRAVEIMAAENFAPVLFPSPLNRGKRNKNPDELELT